MKKERVIVDKAIKDRIKSEMKLHGHTNEFIAEKLDIEPGSYSRKLNGNIALMPHDIKALTSLWGIREEYLLCKDDFRTNKDMVEYYSDTYYEEDSRIIDLLNYYGYKFSFKSMVDVRIKDILCSDSVEDCLASLHETIVISPSRWAEFKYNVMEQRNKALNIPDNTSYKFVLKNEFSNRGKVYVFVENEGTNSRQYLSEDEFRKILLLSGKMFESLFENSMIQRGTVAPKNWEVFF